MGSVRWERVVGPFATEHRSSTLCWKGAAKWNDRKGRGTARSFDDWQLNECMVAKTLSSLRERSAYVAGFSITGATDWTRPTLLQREPVSYYCASNSSN